MTYVYPRKLVFRIGDKKFKPPYYCMILADLLFHQVPMLDILRLFTVLGCLNYEGIPQALTPLSTLSMPNMLVILRASEYNQDIQNYSLLDILYLLEPDCQISSLLYQSSLLLRQTYTQIFCYEKNLDYLLENKTSEEPNSHLVMLEYNN